MAELNATVIGRLDLTPDLSVLRVQPDGELFDFEPGQYTVLGLPADHPRVPLAEPEDDPAPSGRLVKRAYSIASSSRRSEYLEFYVALVRSGALTPRLFALGKGERLWLGARAAGRFTLDDVPADKDLILVSTGTGLAPYISMIRSAHRCDGGRHYTVVHGARHGWDLGYRGELEALDHGCGTFRYVPTLTRPLAREGWTGKLGRVHLAFEDGTVTADPARSHVFLCGNPEMVQDLQARLEARGYTLHSPRSPGTLHVERYW